MTTETIYDKSWTDALEQATPQNIDDVNGINEFKKTYVKQYYLNRKKDPCWAEKLRDLNKTRYAKLKEKKLEEQLKNPIVKEIKVEIDKKEKVKELNKLNYAKRKAKKLEENKLKNPIVKEIKKMTKEEKKIYNDTYINKKKNIMVLCECGNEYSFIQKTQHCKTKKHLDSIKKKELDNEEKVHIFNCQFGDYDQEIRSFPN